MFKEGDILECTEALSSCISWYTSMCIPCKTIFEFLWSTKDIRNKIREQKAAFRSGDELQYKMAWSSVQVHQSSKTFLLTKTGNCYLSNNTCSMWQGIQTVTNYKDNRPPDSDLPYELNMFNSPCGARNHDLYKKPESLVSTPSK